VASRFEIWSLEFIWDLKIGIWNFAVGFSR
jgi:hypothetical protein